MSIEALANLPDIDFMEKDVETLLTAMISEYETAYQETTGESKTLADGDPVRIWIYGQALRIYAAYQLIDQAAKYNLLKYSNGDYLDNLGARVGVTREAASAATVTQRFNLAATQASAVAIPSGTRVSPGNNVFFATAEYAEIPAGETYIDVTAECTAAGTVGNGYLAGQITTLVDPIQYVAGTVNTNKSQGGAEVEDDASLRERIFLKPESFSVAGPEDAYVYFAKAYSQSVEDVSVSSPSAGTVDVRFILTDGEIPTEAMIDGMKDYLSDTKRRPLTDNLTVGAPEQVAYTIDLTYYIKTSNKETAVSIQAAVETAVSTYKNWQRIRIGRDINPSELISRIIQAGAKRVVVNEPSFTALTATEVAVEGSVTVTYGGLEDE